MIVVVPPQSLSPENKDKLVEKGYVIIETDDPERVRVINPETVIATSDTMMAMLHALNGSGMDVCQTFVRDLYKRLKAAEVAKIKPVAEGKDKEGSNG